MPGNIILQTRLINYTSVSHPDTLEQNTGCETDHGRLAAISKCTMYRGIGGHGFPVGVISAAHPIELNYNYMNPDDDQHIII